MLELPSGQILFSDFTTNMQVFTPAGTYEAAWQPTITSVPATLTPGDTYAISGTQFNGLSQGAMYGDDGQMASNYPLVRLVSTATGNVYYCRTHGHSTMGVATGSEIVSTNFDVPSTVPLGAAELYVVANGIASNPIAVEVGSPPDFSIAVTNNIPSETALSLGHSGSYSVTVTSLHGQTVTVNLSNPTGLPAGVSYQYSTSSISTSSSSSATLTLTSAYSSSTFIGNSTVTVTGTSSTTSHSAGFTLVTQPLQYAGYCGVPTTITRFYPNPNFPY
jgi:hypothetical protein